MDAQNAVDAASRKLHASPEKAPAEQTKSTNNNTPKGPLSHKPPADFNSSLTAKDSKANNHDDDGGADANSEAETIVLPGKDGQHSPSKTRKSIKHEAKSDAEDSTTTVPSRKPHGVSKDSRDFEDRPSGKTAHSRDGAAASDTAILKKKRPHGLSDTPQSKGDGHSNGTGSASNSPPPASSSSGRSNIPQLPRRRRLSTAQSAPSDSESMRAHSPKSTLSHKDRLNPADKIVGHKRKAPKAESEDEAEAHKARRQRTGTIDKDNGHVRRLDREHSVGNHNSNQASVKLAKPNHDTHLSPRVRSVSPASRPHRRSISTQLPTQSSTGPGHKKKRIPAPLQPTEYHSDDSSPAGSPRLRASKLRRLATPAAAEVAISPAKSHHRKGHLDAHGQTQLARACAKGDYESTKQRLKERPEDLNVADFAGNTPLQIASLNGFDSIVKLLIDAGCQLDCVNNDKDTPLLDAVENGHAKVVKLLLEAGLNPRKANLNGEEPLDLVDDEDEETRRLLVEARQKMGDRRRASEEHQPRQTDGRDSHGPDSPRHSPATTAPPGASVVRRTGTVRANKTSNHLLYMPMDEKTLRQAAGRGDEETVMRILQVRVPSDDPEAMVAAARGGHDIIMNLLLALGNCNPDPAPVSSMSPDSATPMLAAIGQENIAVVELLLDQAGKFDPTRRFRGETYFEIAKRRQGPHWEEEYRILKKAYDEHKKPHKDTRKNTGRDLQKDLKRATHLDSKDESTGRIHKRKMSSPTGEPKKTAAAKIPTSPKEKRRSESAMAQRDRDREDPLSPKRGPGRPRKDDRLPSIAVNDREPSPITLKHSTKPKRTDAENAAISSEGEAVKPRRKLVSGKDLKGEREKQRRASMVSTASSLREPSSPRDRDEMTDKPKSEKFVDRAKQLKRDESRDRLSVSSEGSAKRHRSSATPPRASSDKDGGDGPVKRRKLDVDGPKEKKKTAQSEDRSNKATSIKDSSGKMRRDHDNEERREPAKPKKLDSATADRERKDLGRNPPTNQDKNVIVKNEDVDVEMRDVRSIVTAVTAPLEPEYTQEKRKTQAEIEAEEEAEARRLEEEEDMRIAEEEKRKQREERERRGREEEQKRKREAEEAEKRRKAEQEERERKRKEDEEKKRKAEEERKREEAEAEELRKRQEEEERRRREEEELKRKADEEAKRIREAEEARQRAEEEERKKREEEERLRREQLEKEVAEVARKKREEEEERKEQERLREAERRRALREAEARRLFVEAEAVRLGKLPPLLRWLDTCAQPKLTEIAQKFSMMQGVRYDCICPEATGKPEGREQWLLNTQVALLLGEKDLELSRYTAWERVRVSQIAKIVIWRVEADRYALTSPSLYDLGRRLPSYYGDESLDRLSYKTIEKLRNEARQKFLDMDLFFVKASDLMFIIPTIPHLRNVKLSMAYRELPEDDSLKLQQFHKWKTDPDANKNHGFAPGNKYYINGALVHEKTAGLSAVSKTPFPENPTPRRGLLAVTPDDPHYAQICVEQGLGHLVNGDTRSTSPGLPSGTSPSPRTLVDCPSTSQTCTNGRDPQLLSPVMNGTGRHLLPSGASPQNPTATATAANTPNGTITEADKKGLLVVANGINGVTTNGASEPGNATM